MLFYMRDQASASNFLEIIEKVTHTAPMNDFLLLVARVLNKTR